MRKIRIMLMGLFVLQCVAVDTVAQDAGNDGNEQIQSRIEVLNADIAELDFLSLQIEKAEKSGVTRETEHDVLLYRQDG